jgi:hypothetical protein
LKKLTNLLKLLFATLLFIASVSHLNAATLYSITNQYIWDASGTWSYTNGGASCGCIPVGGDVIIVRSTDSISVPTNINVATPSVTVQIYGNLNITGFLDLNGTGSVVNIYTGGKITSNGSSSSKLRIGGTGTAEYTGNDGTINGPWTITNGSSGPNSSLLPVTFISFTGKSNGNSIALSWSTAEEINNNFFEVQKSTDGVNFITLANEPANGNHSYSYTDGAFTQRSYYRLKQVDLNGNYTFYTILEFNPESNLELVVSPNPAADNNFTISFNSLSSTISMKLQDANGKEIYSKSTSNGMIDGAELPVLVPGVYYVNANDGQSSLIKKIVIQ